MNDLQKLGLERIIELSEEVKDALSSLSLAISRKDPIDNSKSVYPINAITHQIEKWARAILINQSTK